MKKLAPVLVVDEIEPCLPFWYKLGFEKTVEVPEGDTLGFVILKKGPVEIMYQTQRSVEKDLPSLAKESYHSALFIEVDALDPVIEAMKGTEALFPERRTFYGAREIGYREPGGNAVTFAEFE
ncbi:MAG TPA: VOC family protein [Acidobacteriota bacterium]|nr:VOC family protein [Acidobacteriota bacterium]